MSLFLRTISQHLLIYVDSSVASMQILCDDIERQGNTDKTTTITQMSPFMRKARTRSIFLILVASIVTTSLVLMYLLSPQHLDHDISRENVNFSQSLPEMFQYNELVKFEGIHTIIVIPGGGTVNDQSLASSLPFAIEKGYPLWTEQRVEAAIEYYSSLEIKDREKCVFLCLSAGSLNAANPRSESNQNIIFESQLMMNHLRSRNIDESIIFGDFLSWDTVTNGLVLRMFIEGLQSIQSKALNLQIKVFISDFHANRVKETFMWILNLKPSLLDLPVISNEQNHVCELIMISVSSQNIPWKSPQDLEDRINHENKGIAIIQSNKQKVHTWPQLFAFLLLGPHQGFRKYLLQTYKASKGAGWN